MKKSLFQSAPLIFVLLVFINPALPQEDHKQLEAKRKKLESEIEFTNQLIENTQASRSLTISELRLINKKIDQREELVLTLQKEISYINSQISSTESSINSLNEELEILKKDYAKVVYFAYKHKTSYNKLIFVFSADDLNQAYQRLRYLDQVSDYIKKESENIKNKEQVKTRELELLTAQKVEKRDLLNKESKQLSALENEQSSKSTLVSNLSKKEKQLKADVMDIEKEEAKLQKRIKEIIAHEIKASSKAAAGAGYELTPAEQLLSESFESNKGILPWPIERGVVSETFGVHQHPVLKNVKTQNNGINILTSPDIEARAIFKGKVVSVTTITSSNIAVIIKHGEYFSVYSNLDEVFVNQGGQVDTKQLIGKIHTNLKGKTELHFEVWKGKEIQNPEYWISQ
jgi:septal ring factor EnvC (AmiA/AmiB activator)